ncbi:hypothetical protein FRC12_018759 [Ceratobasidium sp. 428]|nr:hypothetical protein FRC12_018759 [Ceratobasidium sp. 428]
MAIDGPLLPPDLTRTGKKTKPIESRDLAQAGPTATEPGANPIAASTPVPPKRFCPAVRPPPRADVSVADPVSVPASSLVTSTAGSSPSAPTADSGSALAPDSAAAPGSAAAPAPKSAAAAGSAHLLNPADADVAALLAAGKGAYCRVSADLLPLSSIDLFDDGELSEAAESDSGAKAKGANGGAKSKGATAASSSKSATTGKKGAATNKKAASTAKSATTSAAKGSGAKAKSASTTNMDTQFGY